MSPRLVTFSLITLFLILAAAVIVRTGSPVRRIYSRPSPPAAESDARPGAALAQAGVRALEAKDPAAAVRLLEEALQASPANAEWQELLARAREQLSEQQQKGTAPASPQSDQDAAAGNDELSLSVYSR